MGAAQATGVVSGKRPGGVFRWLFLDRATGKVTVAQWPNASLLVFAALRGMQALVFHHGSSRTVVHWAGNAALAWWAIDELIRGVNPFRRLLGAAAIGFLVAASSR